MMCHSSNQNTTQHSPKRVLWNVMDGGFMPGRAYNHDAGYDITIPYTDVVLPPHATKTVRLGVSINWGGIKQNTCAMVLPRSSLSARGVLCHTGVVDYSFTGELTATLSNLTDLPIKLGKGSRVVQIVFVSLSRGCYEPQYKSDRGDKRTSSSDGV